MIVLCGIQSGCRRYYHCTSGLMNNLSVILLCQKLNTLSTFEILYCDPGHCTRTTHTQIAGRPTVHVYYNTFNSSYGITSWCILYTCGIYKSRLCVLIGFRFMTIIRHRRLVISISWRCSVVHLIYSIICGVCAYKYGISSRHDDHKIRISFSISTTPVGTTDHDNFYSRAQYIQFRIN